MRNVTMLVFFLALALLAAGCQQGSKDSGPSATAAFIGGTSALKMSFVENSPPSEVTDMESDASGQLKTSTGFPFRAIVTVENVGEYTISKDDLSVKMSGFFPADFDVTNAADLEAKNTVPFRGVGKDPDGNKIRGDLGQFEFPANNKQFKYNKVLAGNQQFPFRAEACYKYQTKALSQMCLLDDFTKNNPSVCNPTGSRAVSNSAGPIHVTSIAQSVGGRNKLILNFEVKKVGTSDLFNSDSTNKCRDSFSNKDRIGVKIDPGVSGMKCLGLLNEQTVGNTASGDVMLSAGSASFTCILDLTNTPVVDSVKTFEVKLDYYARDSITKDVLVKHLI